MLDDTGNPFTANQRKLHRIFFVEENIVSFFVGKRAVRVHTASVDARDRFWHKRSQITSLVSHELHDLFESLNVIASLKDVGKTEVNLILAGGHLVMGGLNDKAELF